MTAVDDLDEHEAFLTAVFAAPADDTPRLAYADWLDDHDQSVRAAVIRAGVAAAREGKPEPKGTRRGFAIDSRIVVSADDLLDPLRVRRWVVTACPQWYGAKVLAVRPDRPLGPAEMATLFGLPFTQQVTAWDLQGLVEELTSPPPADDQATFALIDLVRYPAVTVPAVEALAHTRGARRIRSLDLTENDLDNDAARALAASPFLLGLERLDLLTGNRFRGKTWQLLIERFGEQVVG